MEGEGEGEEEEGYGGRGERALWIVQVEKGEKYLWSFSDGFGFSILFQLYETSR